MSLGRIASIWYSRALGKSVDKYKHLDPTLCGHLSPPLPPRPKTIKLGVGMRMVDRILSYQPISQSKTIKLQILMMMTTYKVYGLGRLNYVMHSFRFAVTSYNWHSHCDREALASQTK